MQLGSGTRNDPPHEQPPMHSRGSGLHGPAPSVPYTAARSAPRPPHPPESPIRLGCLGGCQAAAVLQSHASHHCYQINECDESTPDITAPLL